MEQKVWCQLEQRMEAAASPWNTSATSPPVLVPVPAGMQEGSCLCWVSQSSWTEGTELGHAGTARDSGTQQ